jgi:ppGpp synthetase/RelA/SpoT-type nucleotidyltranferase
LESTFVPAYAELMRAYPNNPETAKTKYLTFYKTVLNELPVTEFVSGRVSAAKATAHIVEKMQRNAINGVRYLNIHGLGDKNVKTVATILPAIQEQTGASVVHLEKEKSRIFVRLEVPAKSSGSN